MSIFKKKSKFPNAIDASKVGSYPAEAKSGGGYFYDEVLEYRVWVHPESDEVKFWAFPTYEEALAFKQQTRQAEEPLALVSQNEYIDESETGQFIHVQEPRVTEWQVSWLNDSKGTKEQIPKFLASH